jgi:hypothetical protein
MSGGAGSRAGVRGGWFMGTGSARADPVWAGARQAAPGSRRGLRRVGHALHRRRGDSAHQWKAVEAPEMGRR